MNIFTRMRSRYPFPHSFRIVIRPHPTFLLETKRSSCKRISWIPTHSLYSIQKDAFTITENHGQGGLWRFFFLILTSHFGIFQKPITLSPENANVIVLAYCYLYNFLKNSSSGYATSGVFHTQQATSDTLQSDTSRETNNDFVLSLKINNSASTNNAKQVRDTYCRYFNNEGKAEGQDNFS